MNEKNMANSHEQVVIDSVSSIFYFEFDDSFQDVMEVHPEWELVYIDRGECEVVTNEEQFLLKQGEMYFHRPYEPHMLRIASGSYANVFIVSFFTDSYAMRYVKNRKLEANLTIKQQISAILHETNNTYETPLNEYAGTVLRPKTVNRLWGGEQSIRLRIELMLIELIRVNITMMNRPKNMRSKEMITDGFCLKVIDFMSKHLYGTFSMDDLSRELSFSKSYISKRFVINCDCSVKDYFLMMKIDEAKRLIRETDKNFFEISELLMFSNSNYFSNAFKRRVGMTPSQYKKEHKNF